MPKNHQNFKNQERTNKNIEKPSKMLKNYEKTVKNMEKPSKI